MKQYVFYVYFVICIILHVKCEINKLKLKLKLKLIYILR